MTDGRRDCIARTIPSAIDNLTGPITHRIIHDDSGDPDYRSWLAAEFPTFDLVGPPNGRSGFGGAIASAWSYLTDIATGVDYVFHLEDDFTFRRPVNLAAMATVLATRPYLAQLALRRQPWNPAEIETGGVVELHPDAYQDCGGDGHRWLEHRMFFTTNPSLYRTALCASGWPTGDRSEGVFSARLFSDPDVRCGYWGPRDSGEAVTHIGKARAGVGY